MEIPHSQLKTKWRLIFQLNNKVKMFVVTKWKPKLHEDKQKYGKKYITCKTNKKYDY